MELFSSAWFSALLAIVLIDLVLAGDNAIVIALAARNLPSHLQKKAIVWGTVGAIVMRSAEGVVIQSRDTKPLDRYFPELHATFMQRLPPGCAAQAGGRSQRFPKATMRPRLAAPIGSTAESLPRSSTFVAGNGPPPPCPAGASPLGPRGLLTLRERRKTPWPTSP